MKRSFVIIGWLSLLVRLTAEGHVGSPNVFFEGQAGPHPLRVVIRPPAVLPGMAQVDVRVGVGGVTNVLIQATLFEAGTEAAPAPIRAEAVAGETNLFNAVLWLLRNGSYSVKVTVESPQGRGTVGVPLNSAATRRPEMTSKLRASLAAVGMLLFLGAIWLAGAAARDGELDPGALAARREYARARVVAFSTALILTGAIYAGKIRWQTMDREFRNNALYKPLPVVATVSTNGNLRLLHLTTSDTTAASDWDTLVADHGKLMHFFLLRQPDLNAFAHLHPVRRDGRSFENVLPPLPAGAYDLYAEITEENGINQTLIAKVALAAPWGWAPQLPPGSNMLNEVICQSVPAPIAGAAQPFALDPDDSWHASASASETPDSRPKVSPLMGGCNMVFQNPGELIENRGLSLCFTVFSADGEAATLQPYMGMLGHAVVRRLDGEVFTHLHPMGTISMAAQQLFARRESSDGELPDASIQTGAPITISSLPTSNSAGRPVNEVCFPYAFPRPGKYRLWVQVRTGGRVLTGVFDVTIRPAGTRVLASGAR